jgi:ribosomal protein L4
VIAADDEVSLAKSFRNLDRVAVVSPGELEVAAVVWARSLIVSQGALEALEARAGKAAEKKEAADES